MVAATVMSMWARGDEGTDDQRGDVVAALGGEKQPRS